MQFSSVSLFAALLALLAGGALVIQQALNASLRGALQSVAWAGFVSYAGGTLSMLVLALLLREPFPSAATWMRSAGFDWTGGILGATYIAIAIVVVPRIGTAAFISLFVAGQMALSLVVDHYGLLGVSQHLVNVQRVVGAALVVAGAAVMTRGS